MELADVSILARQSASIAGVVKRALLRSGVSVGLIRFVGIGVSFLLVVTIARLLGAEAVGIYGYSVLLIGLAAVPVSNAWSTLMLRATSRAQTPTADWSEVRGLTRIGLFLAIAIFALSLAVGMPVSYIGSISFLTPGVVFALGIVLLLDQISALRLALLRGLDHPVLGQSPEMVVRPMAILIVLLCLSSLSQSVHIAVLFVALIIGSAAAALVGGLILKEKAPTGWSSFTPEPFRSAWGRSAAFLSLNAGLIILNSQIDFLILGFLGSPESLGHYRVAMQIAILSGFAYIALNMVAMQRFAVFYSTKDLKSLGQVSTLLARISCIGAIPVPVIILLWGDSLLLLVFGEGFDQALRPLIWLLVLQVISASFGFAHSILLMAGFERVVIPMTVGSVALNALLCFLLIPMLGIEGAAISSFISLALWNIALWFVARRVVGIDSSVVSFGLKDHQTQ